MFTRNRPCFEVPGFLLCDTLDIRKCQPRLAIKSNSSTISRCLSSKRFVQRKQLRCSLWDNPDIEELEDCRVEVIRPYSKYYVDKQVYYYKGKYYRISDIGLGEQWYALILDDNEPTDLTPERFKGLKTVQKIKLVFQALLSVVVGAVVWAGWNILFASISTFLVLSGP
ncbi:uncharacterized protein Gasu_56330 [Galdieria sulphuraria]|uniref:Uncharacterized protein n=1 Tax=Galdieria sulphuraria TaxID=130081 RepID=M2XTI2_GALSU|nr:uncharacterized protein Gasu_56330 [Galdieria sulphuraria]EME26734.1 hypothetical protein Gasu_56330 [Galdieria sulphuraria]|eukprot:XP_005703254.1 hypothetical protein Gasu_56330 [Galdieria sulphuraria]